MRGAPRPGRAAAGALRVAVVGAGLTGPLAAIFLARHGHVVDVFERRGDPRREPPGHRRSIHLTLSRRGLAVLAEVGLDGAARAASVPISGRRVHLSNGGERFHSYGRGAELGLWSIAREDVQRVLLERAAATAGVTLSFGRRLVDLDRGSGTLRLVADGDAGDGTGDDAEAGATAEELRYDLVIGADGASSNVRDRLHRGLRADLDRQVLDWVYREIEVPPAVDGGHRLPADALHLWPRRDTMFLALPKTDGAFNAICVLPRAGVAGIGDLDRPGAAERLFATRFPDLVAVCPDVARRVRESPESSFVMIKTSIWHADRAVLVGDAAHTAYPFYGQGMISGFEDCAELARCLEARGAGAGGLAAALARYQRRRRPHTDALADLSSRNFAELAEGAASARVAVRRGWEELLARLLPDLCAPLYTLVAHTTIPYAEAVDRARRRSRAAAIVALAAAAGAGALAHRTARLPERER